MWTDKEYQALEKELANAKARIAELERAKGIYRAAFVMAVYQIPTMSEYAAAAKVEDVDKEARPKHDDETPKTHPHYDGAFDQA